ncbi:MAG TPA: glycosyltransferase family 2 protein [Elusimicrobiota bacterium]|nr:glycosyltransferase family 2 protein [Elusimicrobiota bacterium]
MKISVVVPAYNEAATIGPLLGAIFEKNPRLDLEVVVVDDGSRDGTDAAIAAAGLPLVRVLKHPANRGKGAAIRTGLASVTGEIVLIQDADLEYDPADYDAVLEPIRSGRADVVYGSRVLKKDNPVVSWSFYFGGRFLSLWTNLLFGSSVTDEPTCYKAFRTTLLRSLDLTCTGFEFCPEATGKLLRRGIPIVEVPISYRPRTLQEGKKIRWYHALEHMWVLWKLRWGSAGS